MSNSVTLDDLQRQIWNAQGGLHTLQAYLTLLDIAAWGAEGDSKVKKRFPDLTSLTYIALKLADDAKDSLLNVELGASKLWVQTEEGRKAHESFSQAV